MAVWYCGSVQYAAIAQFQISHAYSVGNIVRQLAAPAAGSERAFRCTTAGTSAGAEPSWNLNVGTTTTSGTAVFTEVSGNSTYGWSAAAARLDILNSSQSRAAGGDTVYVASNHDETRAAAITFGMGAANSPCTVVSVNPAGSVPPVAADYSRGAAVRTSGANAINFSSGGGKVYGIDFYAGSAANSASIILGPTGNSQTVRYEFYDCSLNLVGTGAASTFTCGVNGNSSTSSLLLDDTDLSFAATGQSILVRSGDVIWRNGAVTGSTFPTNLFTSQALGQGTTYVEGVDLSSVSGTLVAALTNPSPVTFANCKLHASATLAVASGVHGGWVNAIGCDSSTANYKQARQGYPGKLDQETTIVRSSGASDGTTAISHKVVTNANCKTGTPFISFPLAIWNDATGSSKTLTVETVTDNVTLKNDEFYIEVEYLGNASYPLASKVSSAPATPMTTPSNLTTSAVTWTTTGLTTPVKQKASVSFTPQMAGLVRVNVFVTKISTTVYYCPKVALS